VEIEISIPAWHDFDRPEILQMDVSGGPRLGGKFSVIETRTALVICLVANGPNRKFVFAPRMSAFGGKAYITFCSAKVG
jgi:hypothetical protein